MMVYKIVNTANIMFCRSEGEFVMDRGNTKQEILEASLELFSVQGFEVEVMDLVDRHIQPFFRVYQPEAQGFYE